jgi:hypothetical protein
VIRGSLRDAAQLINKPASRIAITYAYLAALAAWTIAANYRSGLENLSHPEDPVLVI